MAREQKEDCVSILAVWLYSLCSNAALLGGCWHSWLSQPKDVVFEPKAFLNCARDMLHYAAYVAVLAGKLNVASAAGAVEAGDGVLC